MLLTNLTALTRVNFLTLRKIVLIFETSKTHATQFLGPSTPDRTKLVGALYRCKSGTPAPTHPIAPLKIFKILRGPGFRRSMVHLRGSILVNGRPLCWINVVAQFLIGPKQRLACHLHMFKPCLIEGLTHCFEAEGVVPLLKLGLGVHR